MAVDKRNFWTNAVKYITLFIVTLSFTVTGYFVGLWSKMVINYGNTSSTPAPTTYQFGPTISAPTPIAKPKTIPKPVVKKTPSPTPTQTVSTDNSGSSYNNSNNNNNSNSNNGGGASSNGS